MSEPSARENQSRSWHKCNPLCDEFTGVHVIEGACNKPTVTVDDWVESHARQHGPIPATVVEVRRESDAKQRVTAKLPYGYLIYFKWREDAEANSAM